MHAPMFMRNGCRRSVPATLHPDIDQPVAIDIAGACADALEIGPSASRRIRQRMAISCCLKWRDGQPVGQAPVAG
jgi:hypothetical protein